ncbi:bifunctional hydroxymethylpyrimidine kinase/phosphomethylpyrimidine kinase [Microbacterium esteraromaticum]|uniref:Thiamine-phosphate synthase n=1 Tax=Microbacterium esteraromaticum TaxID=57043 RepID=A0A7D7WCA3_9MICO|nr:bifunctional hydroxymethylpyrimidine kinase/phosphomethylpyrimidine kinase [Microbacterium esteraromaticum]QMU95771.1 bifunctional hydroxymethylpyrimidine kinase/phosphomethylpyrimidine kinase [Microbacterium esteraromaticum]
MSRDLSTYLVTDSALCGDRGVVETVRDAVAGGVTVVQLRDKGASDASIVEQLVALSEVIAGRALLVVDDRVDAVLEARLRGARVDGVHVGQSDLHVAEARRLLGPDALIGLTANTAEHLETVRTLPAGTVDYVGVGVIRPTTTKPDHPPALGVDGFRALAAESPVPAVAIGGIGIDDVAPLREAGAAGVAVVSAICSAVDARRAAQEIRRRWTGRTAPRVLSIAGSDPSGGAGIQADLKSIAAHGGYGMAAISALTAQNTMGVRAVHVPPAEFLRAQLDALSDDIRIDAVKIGMLADAEVVRTVSAWLAVHRPATVVLDPVMVATSGDRLLDARAESALRELAGLADVITPNLGELAVLAGRALDGWDDALHAAQRVSAETGALVLVKGGHLGGPSAPDALVGADGVIAAFDGVRIETGSTHGTGCSLSSALATLRAAGKDWPDAVRDARAWLRESLRAADSLDVGRGNGPVNHFAGLWQRGGLSTRPRPEEVREEWWSGIAGIRHAIDELPFIRALADGSLDSERFLCYLAQDALYLREYARVLAEAARLAPTPEEQAFWAQSAQGCIVGELELHASWLTPETGIAAETFDVEPSAVTTAYLDHLRAAAFSGEYAVLIAAVLPCFWLYADLGARLHAGDFGARALDPQHPYASWLVTYADPGFAEANERAIGFVTAAAAAADERVRRRMQRAFVAASEHERAFFDLR